MNHYYLNPVPMVIRYQNTEAVPSESARSEEQPAENGTDVFAPRMPVNGIDPSAVMREEQRTWQDAERLRSLYPTIGQEVQQCVEELCDKMEYEGSRMYDEYPDRIMLRQMAEDIYDRVKDVYPEEEPEPNQELFSMQCPGSGCRPSHKSWMGDLIQIMLLDEMYRRRCRHRRCRRYW